MLSDNAIRTLTELIGAANVLHEKEDLLTFGYDATPEIQHLPDVVVFPTATEQVIALVKFAREEGLPIVPRGSGTGLSGGSVAVNGG
ncbi:MAG: FAD-binding protein, partial [Desulfuromonadales bacterium]|nr:FAD-binding protein [Desulfuromonadales bacterium]